LATLSTTATRHTTAVRKIAAASGEQALAGQQIATAVNEIRGRTRELTQGIATQTKSARAVSVDVHEIAAEITKLRLANTGHADGLSSLGATLHQLREAEEGPASASDAGEPGAAKRS
jgi:methyl-accepting chemotaxis protein